MPKKKPEDVTQRYERYWREANSGPFLLRLYVAGATPASARAIANLKTLCDEHLKGRVNLEVVDIFQQPELAQGEQIIATPTLIKQLPLPLRRFIGDLDGLEGKLLGLDLKPLPEGPEN
jgi:circadian clock protein KaiB